MKRGGMDTAVGNGGERSDEGRSQDEVECNTMQGRAANDVASEDAG